MQHGEHLFIKRYGEYEIFAVRLVYKSHYLATTFCVVVEDDGVLKLDEKPVITADYDLYTLI
jgi:hypothetical protein